MGTSATPEGGDGNGKVIPVIVPGNEPAGGTGPSGGSPAADGTPPGVSGLDRAKLPALLRGMSEEQIGETFDTLFNAVRQPREPAVAPKVEPPKPKMTDEDLRKRFDTTSDDFNPRAALADFVQENYGGLITDISRKANEGMKAAVRGMIPDFQEHEADIDAALANVDPNQINQQVMVDTYLRVVGAKALKGKLADRAKPPKTVEPRPKPDDAPAQLSAEEQTVARVMFRNAADPIAEYHKALKMMGESGVTVKVPGDK